MHCQCFLCISVVFSQKSFFGVLRPNQMHSVFLPGSHQNLLKLLYADSSGDTDKSQARVRYRRMYFRALGAGPFAANDIVRGWHAQCMTNGCNFSPVCGSGRFLLMLLGVGLQNCAEFPDLNRLGLEASLDKLQIITLYSFHCTLLFCPLISRI